MSCLKDCVSLKKVVFASSYLIYDPELYQFGKPAEKPTSLKESDPIYPRNLTGVAKLLHEIELRFISHFKKQQYKIVSARIFRGHGLNSKDIISRWVRSLIDGAELEVFRKEGMFDYIFSEDTAEGLIRLAVSPEAEGIINLGTGKARSVADVLEILRKHFPTMRYVEKDQDVDIKYEASQADIELLKKVTSWHPEFTLEMSVGEIVRYETNKSGTDSAVEIPQAFNILVTSISRKVPLLKSVKTALNKIGNNGKLFGGDMDDECIGKHFVDSFWEMPFLGDNSLRDVLNYCRKNSIRAVIPSRDGELPFWARHKAELEKNGIYVMVSDENGIQATLDKLKFFNEGANLRYPVIQTALNIEELDAESYVVKERFGAGAKSLGLNLSLEEAKAHSKQLAEAIFQPFIKGIEYSIDIYLTTKGEVKGYVCRRREKVVNGESQVTVTESLPDAEKLCSGLAKDLNLTGHLVFQVLRDENATYHIIECNSRFGGASTLSVEAGLDSFYWFLLESMGHDISQYKFFRKNAVIRQVRYATDQSFYLTD
jgi:carbamoyl-phosphate synthase large subunit